MTWLIFRHLEKQEIQWKLISVAQCFTIYTSGETTFALPKQKIHKVEIAQFRMDIKMKKPRISLKGIVVLDSFAECANKSLIFYDSFLFCFGDKRAKKNISQEVTTLELVNVALDIANGRWISLSHFHVLVHSRALVFLLDPTPIVRYFFSRRTTGFFVHEETLRQLSIGWQN